MEVDQRLEINIAQAVTVGCVKAVAYVVEAMTDACAGIGGFPGVDTFHVPVGAMPEIREQVLLQVANR